MICFFWLVSTMKIYLYILCVQYLTYIYETFFIWNTLFISTIFFLQHTKTGFANYLRMVFSSSKRKLFFRLVSLPSLYHLSTIQYIYIYTTLFQISNILHIYMKQLSSMESSFFFFSTFFYFFLLFFLLFFIFQT